MKRFFCALVLSFVFSIQLPAQDALSESWGESPKKAGNPFEESTLKSEHETTNPFAKQEWGDPRPRRFDSEDVPLDGGLVLLLGAGVLYGHKRHRNRRK